MHKDELDSDARAFRMKGAGVCIKDDLSVGEDMMATLGLGETVRIKAGAYTAYTGKVDEIHQAKSLIRVSVPIFNKRTPVELKFSEVEKITFAEDEDSLRDESK